MAVIGPNTGFKVTNTGGTQDLGQRYVSKDYYLDVYANLASGTGTRKSPGLWAWGNNQFGQLGVGAATTVYYSSPIQVGTLTNWKSTASTAASAYAGIKTDGTLWTWGQNTAGQLGNNVTATSYSSPIQIGTLTNWKQISVYSAPAMLAVKTDGTLWGWGLNTYGSIGNGTITNYSSPVQVGALTNWSQVSCGYRNSAAIKTDGTLWGWGFNNRGQLGNNTIVNYSSPIQIGALTNWKQISVAFGGSAAAVKTDGTLWSWGYNVQGQLGVGVAGSTYYSSPIQVGALTNWKTVTAGAYHMLAIKTDGTLWACGYNIYGTLGNNTVVSYSSPIQIGALTNWKQLAGGQYFSAAIKTDGTLWTWGYNVQGQLGNGTVTYYSSPIQVGTLSTWKTVTCGYRSMTAIADGYF